MSRRKDWYEWFEGHWFLPTHFPSLRVHVDARGYNELSPVAIIEFEVGAGYVNWFYEKCDSLEEAKLKAEERLKVLAQGFATFAGNLQ